jgi:hypothetical protein
LRLAIAALGKERRGEIVLGFLKLRARVQGRSVGRFRLGPAALLLQAAPAAEVGLGKPRLERQGTRETSQRRLVLAELLQRAAQVCVGLGMSRVQFECVAKRRGRVVQRAPLLQQQAEVIVGFRPVRRQGEASAVGLFGAGRVAGRRQRDAQIEVVHRPLAANPNRPANEVDAGPVVAGLMSEQTEQMKRLGVARIVPQHATVGFRGLFQAAALVQPDGCGERILHARNDRFPDWNRRAAPIRAPCPKAAPEANGDAGKPCRAMLDSAPARHWAPRVAMSLGCRPAGPSGIATGPSSVPTL